MAFQVQGWELSATLMDNGRQTFTKTWELDAADHTEAAAAATAILGDFSGVSDCEVTGYRISEVSYEDTVVIPTGLNAHRENIARCVLQLASSPLKKAVHDIPGAKDTLFVGAVGTSGYNVVDTGDPLLVAYFEEFEAAGSAFISDGEKLAGTDSIIRGARVHKGTGLRRPG